MLIKAQKSRKIVNFIQAHLGGGMDFKKKSYAGVSGYRPTEKEQKFVFSSFDHNPPYLHNFCVNPDPRPGENSQQAYPLP